MLKFEDIKDTDVLQWYSILTGRWVDTYLLDTPNRKAEALLCVNKIRLTGDCQYRIIRQEIIAETRERKRHVKRAKVPKRTRTRKAS